MKLLINSILFPLILIVALLIFTGWINKITSYDERSLGTKTSPTTTMFDAAIQSYNLNGDLENSVDAGKIEETERSEIYHLTDADIKFYRNGKIAQNMLSQKANYNANTKEINVSGAYKQRNKNNRLEIIINDF